MSLPSLLLVDDDQLFCQVLAKAMHKRGFAVNTANSVEQAQQLLDAGLFPDFAVLDLSMPGGPSGLLLVELLHALNADMRIVVLTGYASVATAVEAIKLGAIQYLAKPANTDEIINAFGNEHGNTEADILEHSASVRRLEWEHIQRVLVECDGNISAAARKLSMHRRTLQRKLAKRPVKS